MSRISYCSLEEAWGNSSSINKQNDDDIPQKTKNNERIFNNKYETLEDKSREDRETVIQTMNSIERNNKNSNEHFYNQNNIEYNSYRNNQNNIVKKNDYDTKYTPFDESMEKKKIQDKLIFLENELRKYRQYMENQTKREMDESAIEYFDNQSSSNNSPKKKNSDLFDLIVLVMIGLLLIFVMDSIFKLGKSIGTRKS